MGALAPLSVQNVGSYHPAARVLPQGHAATRIAQGHGCLLYTSYTPMWWAFGDSNPGPDGYEPSALTNWAKGPSGSISMAYVKRSVPPPYRVAAHPYCGAFCRARTYNPCLLYTSRCV